MGPPRREAGKTANGASPNNEKRPKLAPDPNRHRRAVTICDLSDNHSETIYKLFQMGLESLRNISSARKTTLNRDGDIVDLGPDHEAVVAAMNLLMNLSMRGRQLILMK